MEQTVEADDQGGSIMRRFIAGAVCPQCRAVDRLVVEELEGARRRRCVACGHSDTMATGAAGEPPTRLSRRREADPEVSAVRIVEPPKRRR